MLCMQLGKLVVTSYQIPACTKGCLASLSLVNPLDDIFYVTSLNLRVPLTHIEQQLVSPS